MALRFKAAEASQRSYLITGEHGDLIPLGAEVAAALTAAQDVGRLTADNPRQQIQSEEARADIQELATVWRETAAARAIQGPEEARKRVLTRRSTSLMSRISARLDAMSEVERNLLEAREESSRLPTPPPALRVFSLVRHHWSSCFHSPYSFVSTWSGGLRTRASCAS